jgi:hypothetical protein
MQVPTPMVCSRLEKTRRCSSRLPGAGVVAARASPALVPLSLAPPWRWCRCSSSLSGADAVAARASLALVSLQLVPLWRWCRCSSRFSGAGAVAARSHGVGGLPVTPPVTASTDRLSSEKAAPLFSRGGWHCPHPHGGRPAAPGAQWRYRKPRNCGVSSTAHTPGPRDALRVGGAFAGLPLCTVCCVLLPLSTTPL